MTDQLKFSVDDGIGRIVLNRPERMNAFTFEMIDAWRAAIEECRRDGAVKVVIVTGAGAAFCSGGDIVEMGDRLEQTPEQRKAELFDRIERIPLALEDLDKPVIAAVNGVATGAGMDMALMCDLRYAAQGARFAETYVNVTAVPDLARASATEDLLGEHYWIPLQGYGYQLFVRTNSGQYLFPYDYNPETGFEGNAAPILYSGKITPLKSQAGADALIGQLEKQGVTVDKEKAMVLLLNEAPSAYRPVVPVMPVLAWMWLAAFVGLVQIWRGKSRVLRTSPQPRTA